MTSDVRGTLWTDEPTPTPEAPTMKILIPPDVDVATLLDEG